MSDANNQHSAPEWLNEDYLGRVLQKYKNNNELKIIKLKLAPATGKGEHYASVMTRVTVEFLEPNKSSIPQHESLIVKSTYENDPFIASIMDPYDVCNTEMRMYEQILPKFAELLRKIGDQEKLYANTIHVDYDHSVLIFEDLAVSKYVLADRCLGMDETHARLALRKLAKMHAAAAVLNERTNGQLENFDHGIFNRYTNGLGPYFEFNLAECANYAGNCTELGPYYKDKLLKLKRHVVEHARRVFDRQETHFKTLNHGDYWVNNIMVRYDCQSKNMTNKTESQKILKELLMIDFQFCSWTTPAVDLHYFFNTSLVGDLRLYQQDKLVQYYYQILTQTLRALHFTGHIPTLHELHVQLEAGRFYAVTSALIVQPVMINDKNADADFNSLMLDNVRGRNFRKILYMNPVVQKNIKTLLPFFDRRGLLDVVD